MSYLDELVAGARSRAARLDPEPHRAVSPARDLVSALRGEGVSVIAEIKRATPSLGDLNLSLDAREAARSYARGGAAAVSVLTEPDFFKGSLEDVTAAAEAKLPVLCKDFIVDGAQIAAARAAGADSVLLIVRILDDDGLLELLSAARALHMEPLVEVHDEGEVDRAVSAGARVIGINHRDLETFEVDPQRSIKLLPLLPHDCVKVALSGVSLRSEVEELAVAGADAVLVGEALVRAPDPEAKLRRLLGR